MKSRALSLFILAAVVIVPVSVSARMYQWVDPDTRTTPTGPAGRRPGCGRASGGGRRGATFSNRRRGSQSRTGRGRKIGAEVPLPGVDQATIERLKAIIGEWDRRQAEEAKRFLEGQAVGSPGAPPAGP